MHRIFNISEGVRIEYLKIVAIIHPLINFKCSVEYFKNQVKYSQHLVQYFEILGKIEKLLSSISNNLFSNILILIVP